MARPVIVRRQFDLTGSTPQSLSFVREDLALLIVDSRGIFVGIRGADFIELARDNGHVLPDHLRVAKVAPDGSLTAMIGQDQNSGKLVLVIADLSNGTSRQVSLDEEPSYLDWISSSRLVVGVSPETASADRVLKWIVDASSDSVFNLEPMTARDGAYAWSPDGETGLALRSLLDGVDVNTEPGGQMRVGFPWLASLPYYSPGALKILWTPSGFYVVDTDPTQVQIFGPTKEDRLFSSSADTIRLEFGDEAAGGGQLIWADKNMDTVGILRSVASTSDSGLLFMSELYKIDVQTGVADVFRLPTGISVGQVYSDLSGQFWAWRSQDGISTNAVVLDTIAGSYSVISDCQLVAGWVNIP